MIPEIKYLKKLTNSSKTKKIKKIKKLMNYERKKINLLIGISGSVACIKYLDLIQAFLKNEAFFFSIKLIATQNSCFFLSEEDKKSKKIVIENEEIPIFFDEDEWHWKKKGDPILHIELRKWADIFLIAPLSANTMGKISNGLCDNLLVIIYF